MNFGGLADRPELRKAISQRVLDLDKIKEAILQAYAVETGITEPNLGLVASWFEGVFRETQERRRGSLFARWSFSQRVMSSNITRKVRYLMERPCQQCSIYGGSPYILFFVRIAPNSRQASSTPLRVAFKGATADDLARRGFDFADFFQARLCVAVTFIMANGRQKSDVDNLAKSLLDSLEGIAYENDEQIEHLDLLRQRSRNDETFMTVRIAVTNIDGIQDVINPDFPVEWVGGPGPIDLSAYLADTTDDNEADAPPL